MTLPPGMPAPPATKRRSEVMAQLTRDRSHPTWASPGTVAALPPPAALRRKRVLRLVLTGMRQLVFPKGSKRDKFWAYRLRPLMLLALGKPGGAQMPPARVMTLNSPVTQFFGNGAEVRTILLTKVDHIGDLLLALPAVAALRRSFPDAAITLMCGRWNTGIAAKLGVFERIIPIDFFPGKADAAKRPVFDPAQIEALGLPMFDVAIDLRVDEDTRVLLHYVSARFKAGYFSRRMPSDMAVVLPQETLNPLEQADMLHHQRSLMMKLVSTVVAYLDPLSDTYSLLSRITAEHEAEARALTAGLRRPVVAVNTLSGRDIKNWPLENFIAVCRWITGELGGTIVLLGGPGDAKNATAIERRLGNNQVRNLVGQLPLDKSFAVLRTVDLYLGNDSGLTHAAASSTVPTVAVYSGIDPIAMWIPLGPHVAALKADVPCSPCHLTHVTDCPNGHACIRAISVNTVKLTIQRMLGSAPRALPAPAA